MIKKKKHPIQYSDLIEETIVNQTLWNISDFPGVMIMNNLNTFDNFYWLFYPIFSEINLSDSIEYLGYQIYLINHSKNKELVTIRTSDSLKLVYFVNNSNAHLTTKSIMMDLSDKRGQSFLIDEINEIEITRSNNIQTCIIILELKNFLNKKINYN